MEIAWIHAQTMNPCERTEGEVVVVSEGRQSVLNRLSDLIDYSHDRLAGSWIKEF